MTQGLATALRVSLLSAFQFRDYRLFWTGSVLVDVAWWLVMVARGWLVMEMTGSAFWVGATAFAAMIPVLVLSVVGGILADRWERRGMVMVARSLAGLSLLLLGGLVISNQAQLGHILAISVLQGISRSFDRPASEALLPNLVSRSALMNAVSWNSAALGMSQVFGPALAVPLLAFLGAGVSFHLAGLFYLASGLVFLGISLQAPTLSDPAPASRLSEGFTLMLRKREVLTLIVSVGVH